jgi:hypothetical protein
VTIKVQSPPADTAVPANTKTPTPTTVPPTVYP